jgi:hypothetical protein
MYVSYQHRCWSSNHLSLRLYISHLASRISLANISRWSASSATPANLITVVAVTFCHHACTQTLSPFDAIFMNEADVLLCGGNPHFVTGFAGEERGRKGGDFER